jgi:hypothetical protein
MLLNRLNDFDFRSIDRHDRIVTPDMFRGPRRGDRWRRSL